MKIEMGKIPVRIALDSPQVGDVYRAKGGRGDTKFWLIVALTNGRKSAHALGLDAEGNIVSSTSYGAHAFAERDVVGRVTGLDEMRLEIEWEAL